MIHYHSPLFQWIRTVVFFLPYATDFMEEKQSLPISMFENFIEDYDNPTKHIRIQVGCVCVLQRKYFFSILKLNFFFDFEKLKLN